MEHGTVPSMHVTVYSVSCVWAKVIRDNLHCYKMSTLHYSKTKFLAHNILTPEHNGINQAALSALWHNYEQ